MKPKRSILISIVGTVGLFGQFPLTLGPNDISGPIGFTAKMDTEFILSVNASANTNWSQANSESATLVVSIDGNWNNYNQDIVLYAGENLHFYHTSLGPISSGEHSIQFKFDES